VLNSSVEATFTALMHGSVEGTSAELGFADVMTVPRVAVDRLGDLHVLLAKSSVRLAAADLLLLSGEGTEDGTPCMVCLESMLEGQDLTRLPCCHLFHKQCTLDWMSHRIRSSLPGCCPSCNLQIVLPAPADALEKKEATQCFARRYVIRLFLLLLVGVGVLAGLSTREREATSSVASCPPGKYV